MDRLQNLSARADARRGLSRDLTRYTTYYLDAYIEHLHDSPVLREAHARAATWANMALTLGADERLAGELCHDEFSSELVYFYYSRGTMVNEARVTACREAGRLTPDIEEKLARVRAHSYMTWPREQASETERLAMDSGAAPAQIWGGHLVLDHPLLLTRGWEGIAAWVEECAAKRVPAEPESAEFYEAMRVTIRAAQRLMWRYAELADAETLRCADSTRRRELGEIAARCWHLAHGPARDFREAIQQLWFLHSISGADSVGRFDQYLWAYYQRDLAAGKLTREEAFEWVVEFWLKVAQTGHIQNLTIGGQTPEGADATNELTYIALEATRYCHRPHPNLCLRLHPGSPQRLWEEGVRTIAAGTGTPALYNDAPTIAGMMRLGVPLEEARDWCPAGCSQTVIPGRAHFMNDAGLVNAAKILELALHDGYDNRLQAQVGPRTGAPESLGSFEAVEEALRRQISYFAELEARVNNLNYRHFAAREGYALRSLFTQDCVARGKNIWHGGARYNGLEGEIAGLTNLADSLAAIREVVFEKKLTTLAELVAALDADFAGHDTLRAALKQAPKFGNGDPRVDELRARFSDFLYRELQKQPAEGGGVFIPGEVVFTYHESCGRKTGASADGRLAYTVLADSAGASQGQDRQGPTALLQSAAGLPHDLGTTSIVLNMKFAPSFFATPDGIGKMIALFKTYFQAGGLQAQINVLDRQTLIEAQAQPEAHANLVVRVGGFSAYFVALSRDLQNDIIARTAH
jgi:formate C-acetyltransferase